MNKEKVIRVVRYTFISILVVVLLLMMYQKGFGIENSAFGCFITGLSFTLTIVVGFIFRKDGLYERKFKQYSDKEVKVNLLTSLLTMTLLLFIVTINSLYYINIKELSILLTSIQLIGLITFKILLRTKLKKFLH